MGGVGHHGRRERTAGPVGALETLVQVNAARTKEHRLQAGLTLAEDGAADGFEVERVLSDKAACGEHTGVGSNAVEEFQDAGALQRGLKWRKIGKPQGIHDVGDAGIVIYGELEQRETVGRVIRATDVDLAEFGVNGEQTGGCKLSGKRNEIGGAVNIETPLPVWRRHGGSACAQIPARIVQRSGWRASRRGRCVRPARAAWYVALRGRRLLRLAVASLSISRNAVFRAPTPGHTAPFVDPHLCSL